MTKKLLLTGLIGLCSIGAANAVCTPPTTLKCECQHPIINSEGKLACGEDYCAKNGKKCMPDGSCCEADKFCESSVGKQCCPDGQTCDTTKGCVEESQADCTADLDNNGSADGQWVGSFCVSTAGNSKDSLEKAKQFCSDRSMTLVRVKDICPSWNGSSDYKCSSWTISLDGLLADWGQIWFWTSETGCTDYATIMATSQDYGADGVPSVYCATANEMSGLAIMVVCK